MNTKMKLIFPTALVVAMMAVSAQADTTNAAAAGTNSAASTSMTALFGDPVIAKGKGVEIKQSALDEVVLGLKSAAAARNEKIPPQQLLGIEAQMLNRLVQIQLLLQKATDADKVEGKKKAETQIAALLERAGSEEAFDRQLKAVGMTATVLRTEITQEATATAALTRELGIKVTDQEATNFYASHPTDFEKPETVTVRHILLLTMDPATRSPLPADQIEAKRKQIDDILKRVKSGEDFAMLAEKYSEDPGSKVKGAVLAPAHQLAGDSAQRQFRGRGALAAGPIADALAAAHQERGQREQQQLCARLLGDAVPVGGEIHVGAAVAPQPDGLRRFPFALAHEKMLRLGGLAPIDRGDRVLGLIAAELPEAFAAAGAPSAMHPQAHRSGEAVGFHQERRQGGAQRLGFMLKRRTQRSPRQRRSMTLAVESPPARAVKLSAMR